MNQPRVSFVFSIGDTVRHPVYGDGKVCELRALQSNEPQYRVLFGERQRWLYADTLKATQRAAKVTQ